MKINLGCGRDARDGWVNVDSSLGEGVNVLHDLNITPLPFGKESASHILASHVLEHLWQWEDLVIDCYRVLRPGGTLEIRVPYKLRGFDSAYHVRFFTPVTMEAFCMSKGNQSKAPGLHKLLDFEKVSVKVNWEPRFKWHWKHYLGVDLDANGGTKIGTRRHEIVWTLRKPIANSGGN